MVSAAVSSAATDAGRGALAACGSVTGGVVAVAVPAAMVAVAAEGPWAAGDGVVADVAAAV